MEYALTAITLLPINICQIIKKYSSQKDKIWICSEQHGNECYKIIVFNHKKQMQTYFINKIKEHSKICDCSVVELYDCKLYIANCDNKIHFGAPNADDYKYNMCEFIDRMEEYLETHIASPFDNCYPFICPNCNAQWEKQYDAPCTFECFVSDPFTAIEIRESETGMLNSFYM